MDSRETERDAIVEEEFGKFFQFQMHEIDAAEVMLTGSMTELPLKYVLSNVSDLDNMNISLKYLAMPYNALLPEKYIGSVYRIDTKDVHRGFARLRYDTSRVCLDRSCTLLDKNSSGPAYMSPYVSSDEINEISSKLKTDLKGPFREFTIDIAYAIHCPIWPKEADEWITRRRIYQWPTMDQIKTVLCGGCHFVCKSHPRTPNDKTTFRFSFSNAETLLVKSWSDRQKYIYHILRLIKSDLSRQSKTMDYEPVICSYTMKTLMLWACENEAPDFWINRSNDTIARELLCRLRRWLVKGKCPNYFLRTYKMFDQFHETELKFTVELLDTVISNENHSQKMIYYDKMINDQTSINVRIKNQLARLLQLWIRRESHNILSSLANGREIVLGRTVDCDVEFRNLFQAMLTQRRTVELRNTFPCRSTVCRRLEHFAEENFRCAMTEFDESVTEVKFNLSLPILENAITDLNRRKISVSRRFKICVYSRGERENVSEGFDSSGIAATRRKCLSFELVAETLFQALRDSIPKATYFISAAYCCNYYFSYLKDYERCLSVCGEAFERFVSAKDTARSGSYLNRQCSVIINSEWSSLFDKYIQVSFGFLLSNEYLVKGGGLTKSLTTLSVYVAPVGFLMRMDLNSGLSKPQWKRRQFLRCCSMLLDEMAC